LAFLCINTQRWGCPQVRIPPVFFRNRTPPPPFARTIPFSHSSSSSTGSSPLGIVIEFRRSSPQPPTSLSPSHTHALLTTAATAVSSSSLALVHHHRTIPHLSFVGDKAPRATYQTNMSVEEGYDDYDHRLDGNDDDVRVDSAVIQRTTSY